MGGGGKKGGGGGGSAGKLDIPQGAWQAPVGGLELGNYAQTIFNPVASMANWAASLATGGAAQPLGTSGIAGQDIGTAQMGAVQQLGQGGVAQQATAGAPPGTHADTSDFQTWFSQNHGKTIYVNGRMMTVNQDLSPDAAYQAWQSGGISTYPGAALPPQITEAWSAIEQQQQNVGQMPGIEAQTQALIDRAKADEAKYQAVGDVQEQKAQELYGVGMDQLTDAQKQIVQAEAIVSETTQGEGLFPAQAAMVERARQNQRTQIGSMLGSAGLGESTQLAQMQGEADLAAAATAGQLQQGNIQAATQVLGGAESVMQGAQRTVGLSQVQSQVAQQSYALSQAAQKIGIGGQTLLAGEQKQLADELSNIASQSMTFHQNLWSDAMAGYGLLGNLISSGAQSYGVAVNGYNSIMQAQLEQNKIQAGLQEKQMEADQQGTADLFKGLGTLFGGQGSGGGGIFGSLGSLFGLGGGAAAGGIAAGGAAAAAGGSASGIGISAAVTAIGAAF